MIHTKTGIWSRAFVVAAFTALLFSVFAGILFPKIAAATTSYSWRDSKHVEATILVGGTTPTAVTDSFTGTIDGSGNGTYTYRTPAGCTAKIYVKYDSSAKNFHAGSTTSLAKDNCNLSLPDGVINGSGNAVPPTPGAGGTSASQKAAITCGQGSAIDWIACPLSTALQTFANFAEDGIVNLLNVSSSQIFQCTHSTDTKGDCATSAAYYTAWSTMRDFALAFLAIAALVMIIAQALGSELVDAYTIRKVLPRLLIAIIGISLSWILLKFFIDFTNDLGNGIRTIIYYPFRNIGGSGNLVIHGGTAALGYLFAGIGAFALGPMGLLSFVGTAALAASVAFLVLVLRQIIIVFLVLLAPLAIAAYILPGSKKAWSLWWDSLAKALLMFPMIAGIIAVGHVFAMVSSTSTNPIGGIIAIIAYIAPYFMIPFTVKFAGGLLNTLGTVVNDRHRGGFDRLKGFRQQQGARRYADIKRGRALPGKNRAVEKFNTAAWGATNISKGGANPLSWKTKMRQASRVNSNTEAARISEESGLLKDMSNDEPAVEALRRLAKGDSSESVRQYLQTVDSERFNGTAGGQKAISDVMIQANSVLREGSSKAIETAALLANAGNAHGFDDDKGVKWGLDATGNTVNVGTGKTAQEKLTEAIADTANGDRSLAANLTAQAKSGQARAGRMATGGASFGALYAEVQKAVDKQQGVQGAQPVDSAAIIRNSFESNDGVTLLRGKPGDVESIMHVVEQDAVGLHATQDKEGNKAKLEFVKTGLQKIESSAGMYGSPLASQPVINVQQILQSQNISSPPPPRPSGQGQARPDDPNSPNNQPPEDRH